MKLDMEIREMNIHEAVISGKPFSHPDMLGAWMIVEKQLIHRDNIADFRDIDWIIENCCDHFQRAYGTYGDIDWMTTNELIRTDWYVIDFEEK